jgi:hypothetical protein
MTNGPYAFGSHVASAVPSSSGGDALNPVLSHFLLLLSGIYQASLWRGVLAIHPADRRRKASSCS